MKACCEEMKVFLRCVCVVDGGGGAAHTVNIFEEDGVPRELYIAVCDDEVAVPNIIFRFCPYCGSPVSEREPDTSNPVVKRFSDLIFNKEIDEAQTISARTVVLDETIVELRKLLKAGATLL